MPRHKFRHDQPKESNAEHRILLLAQQEGFSATRDGPLKTDVMIDGQAVEIHGEQHDDATQEKHDLWKEFELRKINIRILWLPEEWCSMKYRKYLLRIIKMHLGMSTVEVFDE